MYHYQMVIYSIQIHFDLGFSGILGSNKRGGFPSIMGKRVTSKSKANAM